MKNIYVGLLAAVTCTYSMQAAANSLNSSFNFIVEGNVPFSLPALHTETPLDIRTISHLDNAVKLASVCSVNGGGSCGELHFNSMNTDCENEGYVKTCPEGQVKDGNNVCPYNNAYFKCRDADNSCDAGYSTTECSDTQVAVSSYQNEAGKTCYQCRDKTCSEGGYTDSLTSCQKGSTVSFANKTCYQNVTEKTCEDLGYASSQPENKTCETVNDASTCGQICYQCRAAKCEDKSGYLETCPENHKCNTKTDFAGLTCYVDNGELACTDGNYKPEVPTNQVCVSVQYAGKTCFDQCHQPTCEEGGYVASCPSNQTGTKIEYFGKNCYKDCKDNTCTVEGCETCVDGSTTKCKKCKLGWRLDPNYQDCYEFGYKCCGGSDGLYGPYDQESGKFEYCGIYSSGAGSEVTIVNKEGYYQNGYSRTEMNFIQTHQCESLKNGVNASDQYGLYYFYILSTASSQFDCSSIDLDYSDYNMHVYITSPAYTTGTWKATNGSGQAAAYNSKPSQAYFNSTKQYGELYEYPEEPNIVNITVKSFTSPNKITNNLYSNSTTLANVNLTSKEKVVLYNTYLSNSTLTAPEIHIKGYVTLANSKLIADNIYIYSDGSIGTSANIYAVEKEYRRLNEGSLPERWADQSAYTFTKTADAYDYFEGVSVIGSPEHPVAFHTVKDELPEDVSEFQYQPITIQQNSLTIYGYNPENTPIFSEAINKSLECITNTGQHPIYTLTITDILGKGKSNLFRYYHTHKYDQAESRCSDGKLIYSKDFNNHSQTFYEEMKQNSYFITSDSCTLGSAQDMVTYEDKINYDNASCPILGLKPSSAPEVCTYYRYCENDLTNDPQDLSEEYRRHWCKSCDTGENSGMSYNECLAAGTDEQTCLSECSNENFYKNTRTGKYYMDAYDCKEYTESEEDESSYVCEQNKELYQNSSAQNQTLACYSCKLRYCIVPGGEDGDCLGYINNIVYEAHKDSHYSALCTILQSGESAESACNRIRNTWNTGISNTHEYYLSSIKPFATLQALDGSCIVCEGYNPNYK